MPVPLKTLQVFLQQLTVPELVRIRHNAIQVNDRETKRLIDAEIKRRDDNLQNSSRSD